MQTSKLWEKWNSCKTCQRKPALLRINQACSTLLTTSSLIWLVLSSGKLLIVPILKDLQTECKSTTVKFWGKSESHKIQKKHVKKIPSPHSNAKKNQERPEKYNSRKKITEKVHKIQRVQIKKLKNAQKMHLHFLGLPFWNGAVVAVGQKNIQRSNESNRHQIIRTNVAI